MTGDMFREWIPTLRRNIKTNGGLQSFVRIALGDFLHVGEIFPSSPWACRSVVKNLSRDAKVVVEYGSGNGVVTKQILRTLSKKGKLITIEVNENFIPQLRAIQDERLEVVHGDVLDISSQLRELAPKGVDAVVSGIPFTFIAPSQRAKVIANTREGLKEGGSFIIYQNSTRVRPLLKSHFEDVRCFFEPRNIFPYFIMVAKRTSTPTHSVRGGKSRRPSPLSH